MEVELVRYDWKFHWPQKMVNGKKKKKHLSKLANEIPWLFQSIKTYVIVTVFEGTKQKFCDMHPKWSSYENYIKIKAGGIKTLLKS